VLTYPRHRFALSAGDNLGQVRKVMSSFDDQTLATHAEKARANGWIKPRARLQHAK